MQLPQSGVILDVGSCFATYLPNIIQTDRALHCLDPLDCPTDIPQGATFYNQNLIGNTLPRNHYDAVLLISVLEHVGLPCYGHQPFPDGDKLALAEIWHLLKPGCPLIATMPAGQAKVVSWYRQYSPATLHRLFEAWSAEFYYWGFDGARYVPVEEKDVERYDYRDRPSNPSTAGAGALVGVVAHRR